MRNSKNNSTGIWFKRYIYPTKTEKQKLQLQRLYIGKQTEEHRQHSTDTYFHQFFACQCVVFNQKQTNKQTPLKATMSVICSTSLNYLITNFIET